MKIVRCNGRNASSLQFQEIKIGLFWGEAHGLIQAVGCNARGARGELEGDGCGGFGLLDGGLH